MFIKKYLNFILFIVCTFYTANNYKQQNIKKIKPENMLTKSHTEDVMSIFIPWFFDYPLLKESSYLIRFFITCVKKYGYNKILIQTVIPHKRNSKVVKKRLLSLRRNLLLILKQKNYDKFVRIRIIIVTNCATKPIIQELGGFFLIASKQ